MQFHGRRRRGVLAAIALSVVLVPCSGWAVESGTQPVDINHAAAADLAALPGIGEAKAKAIIEHRTAEPFQSVEDLKRVQGIGDRTFEALRSSITVGGSGQ